MHEKCPVVWWRAVMADGHACFGWYAGQSTGLRPRTSNKGARGLCDGKVAAQAFAADAQGVSARGIVVVLMRLV